MRTVYLDYNATTPLAPAAQEAMLPYLSDRFADPAGEHASARAVDEAIEDARSRVAAVLGCQASEVVWTSGATESCGVALRGLIEPALRAGEKPHLIVTAVEHAAVLGPARFLARCGAELTVVPVDCQGLVDPDDVLAALKPTTRLVSVVHANDEIGAIQPVAEIASRCREEGVTVHADAAQSFGKLSTNVETLGVDLLSVSAHKTYGPKGVGALFVRNSVGVEPLLWGDGREEGLRSGMPNVAGVVGFGAVATVAEAGRAEAGSKMGGLRERLQQRLLDAANDALVFGPSDADRLSGTLCVALSGVVGTDLLAATPEIHASPCAAGANGHGVTLGPTLRAIGADPEASAGAVRLSVGWYTDDDEIDQAADALLAAWERLR